MSSSGIILTRSSTGSGSGLNSNALNAIDTTGIYVITGSGTSQTISLTSTSNTLTITNPSGISGNINIDLTNITTPVTNGFVEITTNSYGQVTATSPVTQTDIITALTYTPYNATNPSGYISSAVTSAFAGSGISVSDATGAVTFSNTGVLSFNTRIGAITLLSSDVTTALGFTPYNATNPSGYISSAVTSAIAGPGISVSSATGAVTFSNTGVLSFNTRTGAVILTSSDVTTALTYIPLSTAGGTMSGAINMGGYQINDLGTPTSAADATNKAYVDATASGLFIQSSVDVATTANLTATYTAGTLDTTGGYGIGATLTNSATQTALIIDGITLTALGPIQLISGIGSITGGSSYTDGVYTNISLTGGTGTGVMANITVSGGAVISVLLVEQGIGYAVGDTLSANSSDIGGTGSGFSVPVTIVLSDRVLVKNQSTQTQNGIYLVTNEGSNSTNWILTRATDYNNSILGQVRAGTFVFVTQGTVNANTGWVETFVGTYTDGNIIIGTDNIIFTQFSGAGAYLAGMGLSLVGNVFANTGVLSFSGGTTGLTPVPATTGDIILAGTLSIANGGTGQTTASAAFNALSPMTTIGDIEYESDTNTASRLAIGNTGDVLTVSGGIPVWAPPVTSGTVTSVGIIGTDGIETSGTNPITSSGTIALSLGAITPNSVNGITFSGSSSPTLAVTGSSSISGSNTGDQTITLTGDVAGSGTGSFATTLATVNSDVGSYTNANITVNAKGLITAASSGPVSGVSSVTASGSGISASPTTGAVIIENTGVTSLTGTANEITASTSTGAVTLSISSAYVGQTSITTLGTINEGTWQGGVVTIEYGGTGQTTASAAFNALSPIITTGDLIYSNDGATNSRLPIGSTGNVLTVSGGIPTWAAPATSGTVTSVGINGTTNEITVTGTSPITSSGTLTLSISATYAGQTSITTLGTIGTGTWEGVVINPSYGGTGINNGSATISIDGDVTFSGGYTFTGTLTGNTSVTFPTSGTLSTTTGTVTSVSLADGSTTPIYTVSGSPVTTTGTLTFTLVPQIPNTMLAGPPSGGAAQPTFRTISLAQNDISDVVVTSPAIGNVLIYNGTDWVNSLLTAGTGVNITNSAGSITITNNGVTSITGTASEITASSSTGAITLSLPNAVIMPGTLTITGTTTFAVGTTTLTPIIMQSGTLNTTAVDGAIEYNINNLYFSPAASNRAIVITEHYYRLNTAVTIASSSAAQSWLGLTTGVTLQPATQYQFEGMFTLTTTGTVASHTESLVFTVVGGLTTNNVFIIYERAVSAAATESTTFVTVQNITSLTTAEIMTPAATAVAQTAIFRMRGTLSINAGGSINPMVTFSATTPGATRTVNVGSFFSIWPIGPAGANISVGTWS